MSSFIKESTQSIVKFRYHYPMMMEDYIVFVASWGVLLVITTIILYEMNNVAPNREGLAYIFDTN